LIAVSRIDIFFEQVKPFKLPRLTLKRHVYSLVKNEGMEPGELSFIFSSDGYLLEMNKKHLAHDYFTDIITFNYVVENVVSGDLFISVDRVKENAIKFKTEWKIELLRVIFHGVLHLVGYNDKSVEEQKLMREKEDYYLKEVDFRGFEI
jgi:rRNA maturation RNase YbeY